MKNYIIVYKKLNQSGLGSEVIAAENKGAARKKFTENFVNYDHIIYVTI